MKKKLIFILRGKERLEIIFLEEKHRVGFQYSSALYCMFIFIDLYEMSLGEYINLYGRVKVEYGSCDGVWFIMRNPHFYTLNKINNSHVAATFVAHFFGTPCIFVNPLHSLVRHHKYNNKRGKK